jgi:hypothetical protein
MFKNISTILIWSEDFKALSDWYKNVFDFQVVEELDHPQDTGVLFRVGNTNLWIGQHSEVYGKNKDIHRHMFNIDVESVTEACEYLKGKDVEFLAEPFKAPTFDKYFATFYDLDQNLVQLIGNK